MDSIIENTVNDWLSSKLLEEHIQRVIKKEKGYDRLKRMSALFEKWNDPRRYNLLPRDDIVSLQAEARSVKTWDEKNIEKLVELAYKVPMNKRTPAFTNKLRTIEKMYWFLDVNDSVCKDFVNMF